MRQTSILLITIDTITFIIIIVLVLVIAPFSADMGTTAATSIAATASILFADALDLFLVESAQAVPYVIMDIEDIWEISPIHRGTNMVDLGYGTRRRGAVAVTWEYFTHSHGYIYTRACEIMLVLLEHESFGHLHFRIIRDLDAIM